MAKLSAADLTKAIVAAMKGVLANNWPKLRDYSTGEAKKLAASLVQIETLKATDQISEAECSVLLEMQKNSTRAVLLAVKGMGLLTVEEALNAALAAVQTTVNAAIGFALI